MHRLYSGHSKKGLEKKSSLATLSFSKSEYDQEKSPMKTLYKESGMERKSSPGIIPRSITYLKKVFEDEFWPKLQKMKLAEIRHEFIKIGELHNIEDPFYDGYQIEDYLFEHSQY